MKKAFYSLLQYCPDPIRNERINIAILLEAPQFDYVGAKYLRWMHGRLACFDPTADVELVRSVARQIELDWRQSETTPNPQEVPLFPEAFKPERLGRFRELFSQSHRSMWQITEPKPILLPNEQRFEDRLSHLYNRLVKSSNPAKPNVFDKQYVEKQTYAELKKRQIELELDPPTIQGRTFPNRFDAAHTYRNGRMATTHVQFLSFDISEPRLDQVRLFLDAVEDLRATQLYTADTGHYFTAIIQPPTTMSNRDAQTLFRKALSVLKDREVPAFSLDQQHLDRVAQALHRGIDPREFEGL